MTTKIDTQQIAKFIFDRHAENMNLGGRADRVAFMVKGNDGKEHQCGGLCEVALAAWIRDAITTLPSEEQ